MSDHRSRRAAPTTLVGVAAIVALVAACSIGTDTGASPIADGRAVSDASADANASASAGGGDPAASQRGQLPADCADFGFSERRCTAIVAVARRELGIDDPSADVELLPEPAPDCGSDAAGRKILCVRSGHIAVIVRITPPGGAARDATFFCGVGGQYSIACSATPEIRLATPIEGYHDIACSGEDANGNPSGCATPVPPIDPAASAAARPLSVATLDIAIDRDGEYAIEVGLAGIPNGVLTTATFRLATPSLDDVTFDDGGVALVVEPVDPTGRPFRNIYEHGWTAGVEATRVVLRFVVVEHVPGAILPIRDVAVR